jgi:hypothetical protein
MQDDNPYAAPTPSAASPNHYLAFGYPSRRMRFWRITQLKAEMRVQPLSERESLPYLVLFVASSSLVMGLPQSGFNAFDALDTLLSVMIAIVGTIFVYRRNGGIHGEYFLQRYLAIGFVVGVRCIVALLALMIPMIIALDTLGMLSDQTSWIDLLFSVVIQWFVYWRTGYHVRDLARMDSAPAAPVTV